MLILAIIVLLLLAFCFGVGAYLFYAACSRGKEVNWLDEDAVKATPFGKYYTNVSKGHQWIQEHNGQDVYMTNRDGLKLHAVWIPVDNAKGTKLDAKSAKNAKRNSKGTYKSLYSDGK